MDQIAGCESCLKVLVFFTDFRDFIQPGPGTLSFTRCQLSDRRHVDLCTNYDIVLPDPP